MSASKVSNLHVIGGAGKSANDTTQRYETFIRAELLDLPEDGDYLDLIELDSASPDEVLLGSLNDLEKRCFALAQLVEVSIQDTLLEYEASATEAMAQYMRENKVPLLEALQHQMRHLPAEERADMNKRAITHTSLIATFDWSVRARFNRWVGFLIVRKNFTVYTYG